MILQSQTSTSSQHRGSNHEASAAEFLTQLPSLTQVSCKVPLLKVREDATPNVDFGSDELPELGDILRERHRPPRSSQSQPIRPRSASKEVGSSVHRPQPNTNSIPGGNSNESTNVHDEAEPLLHRSLPSSTGDFLDCQPLRTPQDIIPTSPVHERTAAAALGTQQQAYEQPLTLSEQIRAVRADAGRTGLRLSAKWARSVSKTQRAILDADDAWHPPLPGRPHRQGTAPIDLLTAWTLRADREAEEKERQKRDGNKNAIDEEDDDDVDEGHRSLPRSPAHFQAESPSSPSDASSDTREVSNWSSSPPEIRRRILPPDSSPVQQPEEITKTAQDSRPDDEPGNKRQQSQPRQPTEASIGIQEDHGERSHVLPTTSHADNRSTIQEDQTVRSPLKKPSRMQNNEGENSRQAVLSKETDNITNEIQVKETPCLPRADQAMRQQTNLANNIPLSSFVPATFPDIAPNSRKRHRMSEIDQSPRPVGYVDPDYKEFDKKRQRQQRDWKHEHTKPKISQNNESEQKDGSRSSLESSRQSNTEISSQTRTAQPLTEKRLSISMLRAQQRLQSPRLTPKESIASERSLVEHDKGNLASMALFKKFKTAYPNYSGSPQAFETPLKLLQELQADEREPHSFLWDDFIYRFNTDYKAYLNTCIARSENAVSYERFHHQHREQISCTKMCITAEVVEEFMNDSVSVSRSESRPRSHSRMDIDQFELAAISPESTRPSHARASNSRSTRSPTALSIQETPIFNRHQSSQLLRPTTGESIRTQTIGVSDPKPVEFVKPQPVRRSLPWNSKPQSKSPALVNMIHKKVNLTPQNVRSPRASSEVSSNSGRWPDRPHGVRSPELLPEDDSPKVRATLPVLIIDKPSHHPRSRSSQTRAGSHDRPLQRQRAEGLEMCLPDYLTPDNTVLRSIESSETGSTGHSVKRARISQDEETLRKRIRRSELPVTLYNTFYEKHNKLQEEQKAKELREESRYSLNLHSW